MVLRVVVRSLQCICQPSALEAARDGCEDSDPGEKESESDLQAALGRRVRAQSYPQSIKFQSR